MEFEYKIIKYNGERPEEKLNKLMKIFFERVDVDSNSTSPLEVYWDNNMVNIRPSENFPSRVWGFEIKEDGMENRMFNHKPDKIIKTETLCYTLLRVKGQEYFFEHRNEWVKDC